MKNCPNCGSYQLLKFASINKWILIKCKNCALVITSLPPTYKIEKFNKNYYTKEYLNNYEARKDKLTRRFIVRLKEIEGIKRGGNLLDVGCSTGLFLRTVYENSEYRWKLFGIDINKNSIQFAKTKVQAEFFGTSLDKKRFKENFFDCVTCFDVLEHDTDIKGNLEKIYRILKPGGLLVVQVPNHRSVMTYLCGRNWDWWFIPDHVLHFSPTVLSKILSDNDFVIKKLFTWEPTKEFVKNIRGTIKANITGFMSLNRILSRLSTIPLCVFWLILRLVENQFNVGGLIVVLAIKKRKDD